MAAHQHRHQRPKDAEQWDRLAGWYDSWVGGRGGPGHRKVAIPLLLSLLKPRAGESVLDVGCGQGVLAPHVVRAGARYTGIDASARMIEIARRRHGHEGAFVQGDARAIRASLSLEKFDAAAVLFSLQDIDPLEDVLWSIAEVLRPGGRLAFVIVHPAFRIPRQSGWGWDESRKLTYRRIDSYLSKLAIPLSPRRGRAGGVVYSYHRPLGDYLNALAKASFNLEEIREAPSDDGRSVEIPLILGVRAIHTKGLDKKSV